MLFQEGYYYSILQAPGHTPESKDKLIMSIRRTHIPSPLASTSIEGHRSKSHVVGLTAPRSLSTSAQESHLKAELNLSKTKAIEKDHLYL